MSTNNDNAAQWMKNLADDIAGEIEDIGSNHREDYLLKKIQEHAPAAADDSKELIDWLESYLSDDSKNLGGPSPGSPGWCLGYNGGMAYVIEGAGATLREAIRNAKAR